jgi:hypothetical protein
LGAVGKETLGAGRCIIFQHRFSENIKQLRRIENFPEFFEKLFLSNKYCMFCAFFYRKTLVRLTVLRREKTLPPRASFWHGHEA